jgi:hypothetical protein
MPRNHSLRINQTNEHNGGYMMPTPGANTSATTRPHTWQQSGPCWPPGR